jgi:hypothetical protein
MTKFEQKLDDILLHISEAWKYKRPSVPGHEDERQARKELAQKRERSMRASNPSARHISAKPLTPSQEQPPKTRIRKGSTSRARFDP